MTLSELLEQHPWPPELRALGRPLEFFWTFQVAAPVAHLWPHLADSSRMNRALGFDAMRFEELDDGTVRGHARHGGVRHVWTEVPWEWVAEREIRATRIYKAGLPKAVRAIFRLAPTDGGGTALSVYFGWIPRGMVSRRLLAWGFSGAKARYERFLETVAKEVADAPQEALEITRVAGTIEPAGRTVLAAGVAKLLADGHPQALVERLETLIAGGDELDLDRIHVPVYARRWDVPLNPLLSVFLHATRAGLLNMTWDVICPLCRGLREELPQLADLRLSSHCEVCEETFSTSHPNVIEISFRVAPAVREVPSVLYCSAEPRRKQHIVLQRTIAPGQRLVVRPPLDEGDYRVRVAGEGSGVALVVTDMEASELEVPTQKLVPRAGAAAAEPVLRCGLAPFLALVNDHERPTTVIVEHASWSAEVLRPQQVLAFQSFRDLFSHEYLSEGLQLAVGVQTLLFTDMVGSTAFYAAHGDADAYVEVHRHFKVIRELVGRHEGATVKTIGDAVMAVFPRALDGLAAAAAIHRAFGPDHPAGVRLRASIHSGPVIAAPYNGGLDFFGGTVNVAAKLQSCALAGQLALSPEVMGEPTVAEYLAGETLGQAELRVSGFAEPRPVWIWQVPLKGA